MQPALREILSPSLGPLYLRAYPTAYRVEVYSQATRAGMRIGSESGPGQGDRNAASLARDPVPDPGPGASVRPTLGAHCQLFTHPLIARIQS